jgi:hypothetical protein
MKPLKEKVEELLRLRGVSNTIIWRDNRKSTYQSVFDYLTKNPDWKPFFGD